MRPLRRVSNQTCHPHVSRNETVTKIALFYIHEQIWARVPWGRAAVLPAAVVAEAEAA